MAESHSASLLNQAPQGSKHDDLMRRRHIASASRKIPGAQPGLNCDSSVLPLGFYQRGDPDNLLSIETAFRSLGLFQQECNSTFPNGLPASPQVEHINKYGGWQMSPSNVLFTNGECASHPRLRFATLVLFTC